MATLEIYPDPISDNNVLFEYQGKYYPFSWGVDIGHIVERHLTNINPITNFCFITISNPLGF